MGRNLSDLGARPVLADVHLPELRRELVTRGRVGQPADVARAQELVGVGPLAANAFEGSLRVELPGDEPRAAAHVPRDNKAVAQELGEDVEGLAAADDAEK